MIDPGVLAAVGAAAAWATSSTLMATQSSRMDPGSISAVRLACAAIFFVTLLFAIGMQGDVRSMGWDHGTHIVLSALLGLAIGDTLYVTGIGMTGMARAFTIALGTFTVLAYAFSIVFLGEQVTIAVAIGSALVLTAIYLVALRGRPKEDQAALTPTLTRRRAMLGLAIVMAAGTCWAGSAVWTRAVAEDYSTLAVAAVRLPAAALLVSTYVSFNGASAVRQRRVGRRAVVILAFAGIVGSGMGSLFYLYALQEAGAGRAAVLSSMSPLFALPLGALVLRERITPWVAAGTALAVTGIILLSI